MLKPMIPLERVKELMGEPEMSDEEAEAIRGACYAWAELALQARRRRSANPLEPHVGNKKGAHERA